MRPCIACPRGLAHPRFRKRDGRWNDFRLGLTVAGVPHTVPRPLTDGPSSFVVKTLWFPPSRSGRWAFEHAADADLRPFSKTRGPAADLSLSEAWRRVLEANGPRRRAQRFRLAHLVARHAESDFGRDHHFSEIRSAADFRKRVPIRTYDEHEPYIDRVRKGEIQCSSVAARESTCSRLPRARPRVQDDPRHRRGLACLSSRLADLGNFGLRRPPENSRARPIADPTTRRRLAGNDHCGGNPLRRDHRPDRAHAKPALADRLLHASRRLKDQGRPRQVLHGAATLGVSERRHDHRRQSGDGPGDRALGRT